MSQMALGFESDMRITSKPVIVCLILAGIGIFTLSFAQSDLTRQVAVALFALAVTGLAGLAWALDGARPRLGRWFTLGVLAATLFFSDVWLDVPLALILTFLPVGLAAALISLEASVVCAVLQTVLTLALFRIRGDLSPAFLGFVLLAIWATLGLMVAIYRPVFQVAHWTWEYFNSARILLEEARNRKAELEKALQDLADTNHQLARLNQLAQGLRQMAEDARTAKEQFVANVSHELRTPLNMIIGFIEMILQSPQTYGKKIPGSLLADLTVIQRNAEHLSHLIDDVLDLSQIETDQMALTKESIRFQEILEFSTTAVLPLYKLKGLYLKTEVAEDLPEVFCDRTRMREVMLNLLSNAGRFTEQGGVVVHAWWEAKNLHVAVKDTGPGISGEDQQKLFHPFEQLDSSIRRKYGGTGLGLAISKRFIELHDGKIWVESQPGLGTTFRFQIPLTVLPPIPSHLPPWIHPYLPVEQREHLPRIPKKAATPRFVVFEHGNALQRLLTRYMGEVEIVPVASLDEAQEQIANHPARALLINRLSIGAMLDDLKGQPDLIKGMPTIVCSVPEVIEEASAAMGVAGILVKPVTRRKLIDSLAQLHIDEGVVLIVDDEPDALQLFGRMLASSKKKYRVLLARDGLDALHILEECRPDVILLDLVMPNMNGFELLEMRAQNPELQGIPIIVISARNPAGHPVVSHGLAVTQAEGLSVRQMIACIQSLSQILSATGPSADPGLPGDQHG